MITLDDIRTHMNPLSPGDRDKVVEIAKLCKDEPMFLVYVESVKGQIIPAPFAFMLDDVGIKMVILATLQMGYAMCAKGNGL